MLFCDNLSLTKCTTSKHWFQEAVENFKKALELEPDNESYKSNLQIAEDKVPGTGPLFLSLRFKFWPRGRGFDFKYLDLGIINIFASGIC
jgi:hypothetical protein